MQYLSTQKGQPGVVVYFKNGKPIASFPAWLNDHKMPTIKQAQALTK